MGTAILVVILGCIAAIFIATAVEAGPRRWRRPRGLGTPLGWLPSPREARRMRRAIRSGAGARDEPGR
jgi:hypothetical protein